MDGKQKRLQNLKPFVQGDERINRKGAPKTYIGTLKDQGFALSEIHDVIKIMLAMTLDELKEVFQNPEATILEKTVANAMVTSLKKGSLYSMETLLSRVWGTPKQTQDITMATTINIVAPDTDTRTEIEKL